MGLCKGRKPPAQVPSISNVRRMECVGCVGGRGNVVGD